ncbi:Putative Holliday junction resolvase [Porphyromonas macacae]|uniref:Putative pre-16S rRNA nuclease n=1 Tax=Porphyromonas macacae TaxID=28115 RepID=A0A379DGX7_9PORP|nr:Holliday junction resolvase RuvX [Porphyromonas macacae]SUB77601.1 Putative Holliday junction resolvase [Porphyromonas macacae]SUB88777.1 Putative Holliday junction resolvase [Porphyromonas macacae]
MGRIIAIDYGRKRCGIAATDILQLVPGGLCTVPAHQLEAWLTDYFAREEVECVVIGHPRQTNGEESESMTYIRPFINRFKKRFPQIPIELYDERFTSSMAQKTILESGIGKQQRRENKGLVDEISAVIILQSYMDARDMNRR